MPSTPSEEVTVLILLPTEYNPDSEGRREPVEDEKFFLTAEELSKEMEVDGGTIHVYRDGNVKGVWWNQNVVERDVHAVVEVDMVDSEERRKRLRSYVRDVLLDRFHQAAIHLRYVKPSGGFTVTREEVK